MKNPSPINLKSSSEVRAEGWQAEARDADGHLCSTHAPFETVSEMAEYVSEELARWCTVTVWPVTEDAIAVRKRAIERYFREKDAQ